MSGMKSDISRYGEFFFGELGSHGEITEIVRGDLRTK